MKKYYKALAYLALKRPKSLPSLFRLATGFTRFAKKSYIREDGISTPPISVSLRLSYKCNLNCVQCGQRGKRGALRGVSSEFLNQRLSTDKIKAFISEIAGFRPYISFTGGEPLLCNDLTEIIRFATRKHLITGLNTNSTLLEQNAEDLIKSGLVYIFASLDGPTPVIGKDSTERAIRGIKAVVDRRDKLKTLLPLIQIQFCITSENQHHILETAKFINDNLKIDVLGIVPGVFTTQALSDATSKVYKKLFNIEQKYWAGFIRNVTKLDVAAIKQQINEIKNTKWKFRLRVYPPIGYRDFSFYEYYNNPTKLFGDIFCPTPYVFAQLQPNGDIATCGSQPDYIAGNILENKFMDIWNGEKYRLFRKTIKQKLFPSCPRCWGLYEFYKYKV
jgi:MoaA/NifB/PqqE/SkfB family radical SAM enzyme